MPPKGKRRRRPRTPRPYHYYFRVNEWYLSCDSDHEWRFLDDETEEDRLFGRTRTRKSSLKHDHYIDCHGDLLNPIKHVTGGELTLHSGREVELITEFFPENIQWEERPHDQGGGVLWSHRREDGESRRVTSFLRVDECSYLALVQILTSGRRVIIKLGGNEFYRNTALIRQVGWFMEGDHDLQEETDGAIEDAMARGESRSRGCSATGAKPRCAASTSRHEPRSFRAP